MKQIILVLACVFTVGAGSIVLLQDEPEAELPSVSIPETAFPDVAPPEIADTKEEDQIKEQEYLLEFTEYGLKLKVSQEIYKKTELVSNKGKVDMISKEDSETILCSFIVTTEEKFETSPDKIVLSENYQEKYVIYLEIFEENSDITEIEASNLIQEETPTRLYSVYYSNEYADGFESVVLGRIVEETQDLIDVIVEVNEFSPEIQVLSHENNQFEMNQAFADLLTYTGSTGEYLYLNAFAKTLTEYFGYDEMWLTVEGETLVTGHVIYDFPIVPEG